MRIILDDAIRAQHVGDGEVALGMLKFGVTQALVDVHLAPRQLRHVAADALHAVFHRGVHAVDELVDHDGAGINHRIDGAVVLCQGQLIKSLAGGLKPDNLPYFVQAQLLQGKCIHKGLGDGLDGEAILCVTGTV